MRLKLFSFIFFFNYFFWISANADTCEDISKTLINVNLNFDGTLNAVKSTIQFFYGQV